MTEMHHRKRSHGLLGWWNPSLETLMSKYLEYKNRVDLLGDRPSQRWSDEEQASLSFCRDQLSRIESALYPAAGRKKIMAAWQLLHRVSEELILFMPREDLVGFALRLEKDLALIPLPEVQKKEWADKVSDQLKILSAADCKATDVRQARHLFKHIYRSVNGLVDDNFWDLWVKKFLALTYTVFLAILTVFFLRDADSAGMTLKKIVLLGSMGGLMSGVFTGEREMIPKGHFWTPVAYYVMVRPLMGVLAALVVFWAVESQFLVRIVTTEPAKSGVESVLKPAETGEESAVKVSMVTMTAAKGKEHYLYMLLLLTAGFAGDKLLKTIADSVTSQLIRQAEKNKDARN